MAHKSRNAIYALNSYVKNTIGQLQPHIAVKIFDSQIVPIMQYTSEIWFQNKKSLQLETIHLQYLKSIMHVKTSSSSKAIYSEFGRFPLVLKQKCQLISYWKRVVGMDDNMIFKKAYNSTLKLHELGQIN